MPYDRIADSVIYEKPWMKHIIHGERARNKKTGFRGPLDQFIVNDQGVYTAIVRHVRKCGECEPELIVHAYLNLRDRNIKFGASSVTFLNFVRQLSRIRKVSSEVERDVLIRSGSYKLIDPIWNSLSIRERIQAGHYCNFKRSGMERFSVYGKLWDSLPTHTDEELKKLVIFWEVHNQ